MKSAHPDSRSLDSDILRSLFWQQTYNDPRNFAASVLLHICIACLIAITLQLAVTTKPVVAIGPFIPIYVRDAVLFPIDHPGTAGESGGSRHESTLASRGVPPVVARPQMNVTTRVPDDPSVPDDPPVLVQQTVSNSAIPVVFMGDIGDPHAVLGPASDGPGNGHGIGYGPGDGIGSGDLSGWAPFEAGRAGVSVPRVIFDPAPEYTEEARKVKQQGNVLLSCVVGADGFVHKAYLQRALGLGLDEKVIEAVMKWRFEPSMLNGKPVAVQILVEVNFHLY